MKVIHISEEIHKILKEFCKEKGWLISKYVEKTLLEDIKDHKEKNNEKTINKP